ncbi:unnamed protein product [Durusdinium trenchii]|uniref:Uncharacterized protein n=1 Tax=Durusdinium trenchii TaxID=1381693 RepID=A0ABP0HJX2_9DINO
MTMLTSLEMMFSLLLQRSHDANSFLCIFGFFSQIASEIYFFDPEYLQEDSGHFGCGRPLLLKLSGRGEFDATEFLDDDLCMAYRQQLRAFGDVVICMVTCCMILAPGMMVSRLLEQPWMGMMRYLAPWIALEAKEDVSVRRCDSCAFGSPHLKSFRMMAVHMDTTRLARRCSRDRNHVIVEGKYTKASASYTEELAMEIACCFREAILARETQLDEHFNSIHVRGLENQFTNLCATTLQWKEEDAWAFANRRHINLLEMSSLLRLAEKKARAPTSLRVVNLVDSNVIRCAAAKGRSSSEALSTLLLKYNAACLAGDLYFTLPFVPTRFNTSDDPTRGRNVRTPSSKIPLSEATDAQAMGFELGQIFSWALWIYSACLMLFRSAAPCNLLVIKGQLALRSSASLEQPVTDVTSKNRERLLQSFLEWCEFAGFAMKPILDEPALFVEKINEILLAYGRRLYEAGKTYSHYVETINSELGALTLERRVVAFQLITSAGHGDGPAGWGTQGHRRCQTVADPGSVIGDSATRRLSGARYGVVRRVVLYGSHSSCPSVTASSFISVGATAQLPDTRAGRSAPQGQWPRSDLSKLLFGLLKPGEESHLLLGCGSVFLCQIALQSRGRLGVQVEWFRGSDRPRMVVWVDRTRSELKKWSELTRPSLVFSGVPEDLFSSSTAPEGVQRSDSSSSRNNYSLFGSLAKSFSSEGSGEAMPRHAVATRLLLLLLGAENGCSAQKAAFQNSTELRAAIVAWENYVNYGTEYTEYGYSTDRPRLVSTYGDIADWDVSQVTNMSSQIEGFVPYAILRTRNLVGELQDFVDAHPPGVREAEVEERSGEEKKKRRGGAAYWFTKWGALDRLLLRGRWQNARAARTYVNDGLAVLALYEDSLDGTYSPIYPGKF